MSDDEDDLYGSAPFRTEQHDEPRFTARPTGGEKRWAFVEVDARTPGPAAELGGTIGGERRCKPTTASNPGCGELTAVLHADPRSAHPERTLCGICAGRVLRERIGWAQAGEPKESRRG